MAYTPATGSDVRGITGVSLDDAALDPYLTAAQCSIDLAVSRGCGADVTDECKTKAHAYLASHLLATSGNGQEAMQKKSERFENYAETYAVNSGSGSGVLSTGYGESANMLMGGCLVELMKRKPSIGFAGGA
jgi:hypothetical protein